MIGVLTISDSPPDLRYANKTATTATSYLPYAGDRGQLGVMAAGTF